MAIKFEKKSASKPRRERTRKKAPPAYFLSVSVENARCFGPKQTLDLSDGKGRPIRWTVILGDNGTGKTTLLQSLVMLEPIYHPPRQVIEGIRPGGSVTKLQSLPREFYTSRGFPEMPEIPRDALQRDGENNTEISAKIICGSTFSKPNLRSDEHNIDIKLRWPPRRGAELYFSAPPEVLPDLVTYAYGATRKMDVSAMSSRDIGDPTASLFREDAPLVNPEEWLLQTDYAASKESAIQVKSKKSLETIKDILINVLPDVEGIRFPNPKQLKDKPRVEFRTPYGWVPIRSLGLGYRTMIAWTVDLASRLFERYPKSRNPIGEPAVVLIDEIDLHMHPQWQRKIMSFLSERFENTQFIATAHSPLIVQAATDANIAVLRRDGDHVVIDQSIKAIRGWRIDQVLTSDLFGLETARPPEFDEVLKERKNILTKKRLTNRDKQRLVILDAQMGDMPVGENLKDFAAMEIIRRAAERIKKNGR